MNIALLGYGKMGKEIEKICLAHNHTISARIDNENDWTKYENEFQQSDVAIEFSMPNTVIENINKCFKHNIPIIVGTTGWYDQKEDIKTLCLNGGNTLVFGSNFSVGVNLFFHINQTVAKLLDNYPDYKVSMEEIHHTQKLDAPSGTAISLADIIIKEINPLKDWQKGKSDSNETLGIVSKRIDPTPGTHTVVYSSDIDEIELKHTAKSRAGFAKGAVFAAEWIKDKKGWFEFRDILFNKS